MVAPQTGRTGRPLTQHEYFLKTDADYRATYASEVMLRMAKLIEVLALRAGLEFDQNTGELLGITEEEEAKLMAPAVNRNEVREARPVHAFIPTEVREMDPFAASPDPSANFGSEKIEDVPSEPGFLVDHAARNMGYNPSDAGNADIMADTEKAQFGETEPEEALPEEQAKRFALGGYNSEDEDAEPQHLTATGKSPEEANAEAADEESEGSDSDDESEHKTPKEKLQDEAESYGLDPVGTVDELKARIAEYKETNPESGADSGSQG
jgi:hypothetical protein